jgi:hypothetical protein
MSVSRWVDALNSHSSNYPSQSFSISPYKVKPVAQYALRTHVDAALRFAQPEGRFSSDKPPLLPPLSSVVEPPSTIPKKAQASSRIARPSNAFMLFRSEFVKQHKHIGRRQQELSVMAACAWRALGTEGQTGWYEKAALAKTKYDTQNTEHKAPRQRPKPYRSRLTAGDPEPMRPVRDIYATLNPALSTRRKTRKSVDELLSPMIPSAPDSLPAQRSPSLHSPSPLIHAPSFHPGYYHHYNGPNIANPSVSSSHEAHNEHILTAPMIAHLQHSIRITLRKLEYSALGPRHRNGPLQLPRFVTDL